MSKSTSYSDELKALWEKRVKRYLEKYKASLEKLSQTDYNILLWDVTREKERHDFRTRNHIVENEILLHPERENTITNPMHMALCLRGKKLFRTRQLEKFQAEWHLPDASVEFLQSHKALFMATILEYQLSKLRSSEEDTTPPIDGMIETLCTASNQLPPQMKALIGFLYTRSDQTRLDAWYDTLHTYAKTNDKLVLAPAYPFIEILHVIHSHYPLSIIGEESYDRVHEYIIRNIDRSTTPITLGPKLTAELTALQQKHSTELCCFHASPLFKTYVTQYLEDITQGLGKVAFCDIEAFVAQHITTPEPSKPENSPALRRKKRADSDSPTLQSSNSSPSLSGESTSIPLPSSSSSSPNVSEKRGGWKKQLSRKISRVFTRSSSSSSTPEPVIAPSPTLAIPARSSAEESGTTSSDTLDSGTPPRTASPTRTHTVHSKRFPNYRQSVQISPEKQDDLASSSESQDSDDRTNLLNPNARINLRGNGDQHYL